MYNIFAPLALIGPKLTLKKNCTITIDNDSISEIEYNEAENEKSPCDYILPERSILLPGFINCHTHVADAIIKEEGYGYTLDAVVGEKGLKHQMLANSPTNKLLTSIENSLSLLVKNGFTSFVDFREGGLKGIEVLKEKSQKYPIQEIILGRSKNPNEIKQIMFKGDGMGLCDAYGLNQEISKAINVIKNQFPQKIVSIHVSEDDTFRSKYIEEMGESDLVTSLTKLKLDFIVHGNYLEEEELDMIKKKNVSIVVCPLSSIYYGLKFLDLNQLKKMGILFALGTDNVMTSSPDPFELMRVTLVLQRLLYSVILDPIDVLKAITVTPGMILKKNIGQISKGFKANFIAIDLDTLNTRYVDNAIKAVTLRAKTDDILFQMYNGKIIGR